MARSFKGKTFTKILRGYAPDEVESYIAYIDEEYRKLEKTSGDNMRKLALALRKLDEMNNYAEGLEIQLEEQARQAEEQLAKQKHQLALAARQLQKQAQSSAQETAVIEKAKKEAEDMVSEAQLKAEKIVAEAEELARSMKDKILNDATLRAERLIMEAEEAAGRNSRAVEDINLAAVDMYNEICSFRDTLFSAYNTHIESIEEIVTAAEALVEDVDIPYAEDELNLIDEAEEAAIEPVEAEEVAEEAEVTVEELSLEEFLAGEGINLGESELALEEELEAELAMEDVAELDLAYDVQIDELEGFDEEADQDEFEMELGEEEFDEEEEDIPFEPFVVPDIQPTVDPVIDDDSDFHMVFDSEEVKADGADDNGFIEITGEDADGQEEYSDVWAEYFGGEDDDVVVELEPEDALEYFSPVTGIEEFAEFVDATPVQAADSAADEEEEQLAEESLDQATEDTYESYESYGEVYEDDDLDSTIEDLAKKYSQVYVDDLEEESIEDELYDDVDDGSYAPNDEYAWGDDMYAEPDDSAEEYAEQYDESLVEQYEEYAEEYAEQYDEVTEGEDYYTDEDDELDMLKQFFSADYESDSRSYDTSSNSTTSIALSLNDFFDEEDGLMPDFDFPEDEDMSSLFEKDELSVTDEFNIVFGKSDSAETVAEIRRQPIIPAEEPKNPKKHSKF